MNYLRSLLIIFVLLLVCLVGWKYLPVSARQGQSSGQSPARTETLPSLETRAGEKFTAQQWSEAAALFARLTEINPHQGRYWNQLGQARLRAADYRGAIQAFEKTLELGAGYPFNAAYNIACSYALMGQKAEALKWLEQSLEMGYRNLQQVRTDENLKALHSDLRYIKLAALDDVSKMSRDEGWRYDLWLLARELKRVHYDPFKKITKEEFEAYVKKLHDEIPKLTDPQIEVRLIGLSRLMGDGHTSLQSPAARPPQRRLAPVQFYLFTEGLFVTSAAPKHADLVGAQVVRIGDHTIDKVMTALDPVISRDNQMWPKGIGPGLMRNPRVLNGLGLIPEADKMTITVTDGAGKTRTAQLAAEPDEPPDNWPHARQRAAAPEPLYLKNRRANYWFEYLPESKTVYFQYNAVQHDPQEPLPQFCDRLFKFINEKEVERLVIDMRWNGGGNNFLNRPLVHGLIRNDKINQRGKLFVIVGRQTFSAAMNGAAEIERQTNAIFVGEPTGSSPNFVGETIPVELPYSKMRGSISDLFWQSSVAMDYRTWIAPLLYAPPSFELYRANRDPAMEAILAWKSE